MSENKPKMVCWESYELQAIDYEGLVRLVGEHISYYLSRPRSIEVIPLRLIYPVLPTYNITFELEDLKLDAGPDDFWIVKGMEARSRGEARPTSKTSLTLDGVCLEVSLERQQEAWSNELKKRVEAKKKV